MKGKTIGLVGCGRFGSMIEQVLKDRVELKIFDQDPEKMRQSRRAAPLEEVCQAGIVILSVPISAMREAARQMAPLLQRGQLVVDTCSVKTRPLKWLEEILPREAEILGTHPLFGPDSGKEGIAGLKIAVCPVRIQKETYEEVLQFLKALELMVIETTPEEHDRQLALTQAIFHLIAQVMGRLDWGVKPLSTPGPETFYRLVKTVQRDTDQLFLDMERENPFAAECRARFIQEVLKIDEELKEVRRGDDDHPR